MSSHMYPSLSSRTRGADQGVGEAVEWPPVKGSSGLSSSGARPGMSRTAETSRGDVRRWATGREINSAHAKSDTGRGEEIGLVDRGLVDPSLDQGEDSLPTPKHAGSRNYF